MGWIDRKSTRLNSSHLGISYAVFCLKKKKNTFNFSDSVITYTISCLKQNSNSLEFQVKELVETLDSTMLYTVLSHYPRQYCADLCLLLCVPALTSTFAVVSLAMFTCSF